MSGGDLDGDKFFVSWDPELIPEKISEAYGYPAASQPIRRNIKYEDMIKYFAGYNNSSVGRIKNLYLDWARLRPAGALSKECQELNALFSSCIDGERKRVPEHLETVPKPAEPSASTSTFVIDVLCENVKKAGVTIFKKDVESVETTPVELLEFVLSLNPCCLLNEFELFKLTARWCQVHGRNIDDFICYFDFGNFTSMQKHAVVSMLDTFYWRDMSHVYLGSIFNGLLYSDLLAEWQLRRYQLHTPNIRWQKFYSSPYDGGERLQAELQRGLESFQKKLLVFRVDDQLTVAVYIPRRLERFEDLEVEKSVKMFAFDRNSGASFRESTVHGYKLFYDGEIIQIYEKRRLNTFIWFALNRGFQRRAGIRPHEDNAQTQFKVSIALQKFDRTLAETRARVNKQECFGLELYVVSNRDREGHDTLDISMNNVVTTEKLRTLENTPREYNLNLHSTPREFCEEIIAKKNLTILDNLRDISEFEHVFSSCACLKKEDRFVQIAHHLLQNVGKYPPPLRNDLIPLLLRWLDDIPVLAILIVQALAGDYDPDVEAVWKVSSHPVFQTYNDYVTIACALLKCMNEMKESAAKQFKRLPELMIAHAARLRVPICTLLVRQIIFGVRHTDLAAECIETLFSDGFPILELDAGVDAATADRTSDDCCIAYYKEFIVALAMNYLGQAKETCPCDFWGIPIGAEELDKAEPAREGSSYARASSSHDGANLADFMRNALPKPNLGEETTPNSNGNYGTRFKKPVEPEQKCLGIKASASTENGGAYVFETILRIDVESHIRKEDHIRFCATRRPTNQPKQRPAVFDAIVKSCIRGKLEFEIMQAVPAEILDANWNLYLCGSTANMSAEFTALEKLIDRKSEATVAFWDVVGLESTDNGQGQEYVPPENCKVPAGRINDSQAEAIRTAVSNPVTLIWGPPGTGKTTVVVEIILQFMALYPGKRILVAASTHKAVDNVMERFLDAFIKRFGKDNESTEDFIRLTTDPKKVSSGLQKWTLDAFFEMNLADNDKARKKAMQKVQLAKIVFSTCSGAGVGHLRLADVKSQENGEKKKDEKFGIVIVDEASQITEPNALVPLAKNSKFVVMVGDHVQLRPVVTEMGKDCELDTSLFEKLYAQSSSRCSVRKVMLNVQYRMNPELARFPSKQFYDGKLLSGVRAEDRILPPCKFPWPASSNERHGFYPCVFINCGSEESYGGSASKSNRGQATLTARVVSLLLPENDGKEIKVLTPYAKQVKEIRQQLDGTNNKNIEVCTIDGFQGHEADIIIFSTVRANCSQSLGFLNDHRRINVAVTRARKGLIVIGHEVTIKDDKFWKELLSACKYVEVPAPATAATTGGGGSAEAKPKTKYKSKKC